MLKNGLKFFSNNFITKNLGTSLRQNNKKNWGSPALIQRYDFLKFKMGSYGDFYFVAIYKKSARNFLMKISRISPIPALNKMA